MEDNSKNNPENKKTSVFWSNFKEGFRKELGLPELSADQNKKESVTDNFKESLLKSVGMSALIKQAEPDKATDKEKVKSDSSIFRANTRKIDSINRKLSTVNVILNRKNEEISLIKNRLSNIENKIDALENLAKQQRVIQQQTVVSDREDGSGSLFDLIPDLIGGGKGRGKGKPTPNKTPQRTPQTTTPKSLPKTATGNIAAAARVGSFAARAGGAVLFMLELNTLIQELKDAYYFDTSEKQKEYEDVINKIQNEAKPKLESLEKEFNEAETSEERRNISLRKQEILITTRDRILVWRDKRIEEISKGLPAGESTKSLERGFREEPVQLNREEREQYLKLPPELRKKYPIPSDWKKAGKPTGTSTTTDKKSNRDISNILQNSTDENEIYEALMSDYPEDFKNDPSVQRDNRLEASITAKANRNKKQSAPPTSTITQSDYNNIGGLENLPATTLRYLQLNFPDLFKVYSNLSSEDKKKASSFGDSNDLVKFLKSKQGAAPESRIIPEPIIPQREPSSTEGYSRIVDETANERDNVYQGVDSEGNPIWVSPGLSREDASRRTNEMVTGRTPISSNGDWSAIVANELRIPRNWESFPYSEENLKTAAKQLLDTGVRRSGQYSLDKNRLETIAKEIARNRKIRADLSTSSSTEDYSRIVGETTNERGNVYQGVDVDGNPIWASPGLSREDASRRTNEMVTGRASVPSDRTATISSQNVKVAVEPAVNTTPLINNQLLNNTENKEENEFVPDSILKPTSIFAEEKIDIDTREEINILSRDKIVVESDHLLELGARDGLIKIDANSIEFVQQGIVIDKNGITSQKQAAAAPASGGTPSGGASPPTPSMGGGASAVGGRTSTGVEGGRSVPPAIGLSTMEGFMPPSAPESYAPSAPAVTPSVPAGRRTPTAPSVPPIGGTTPMMTGAGAGAITPEANILRDKKRIGRGGPSADVSDAMERAAKDLGVDPRIIWGKASVESGYKPGARAGISSATGLGQFLTGTWSEVAKYPEAKKFGITGDPNERLDPYKSAVASYLYSQRNIENLKKQGLVTDEQLKANPGLYYIPHNLGPAGAKRFFQGLRDNPDAPVTQFLTAKEIKNNPSIYAPGGRVLSAREALGNIESGRFGEGVRRRQSLAEEGKLPGFEGQATGQGAATPAPGQPAPTEQATPMPSSPPSDAVAPPTPAGPATPITPSAPVVPATPAAPPSAATMPRAGAQGRPLNRGGGPGFEVTQSGFIRSSNPALRGSAQNARRDEECATLGKAFNPKAGTAGAWRVDVDHSKIKPGVMIATTSYNDGSGGRRGATYHTAIALSAPDKNGNVQVLEQFRGQPARIKTHNVNNYKGVPYGVVRGATEPSLAALEVARKLAEKNNDRATMAMLDKNIQEVKNSYEPNELAKTNTAQVGAQFGTDAKEAATTAQTYQNSVQQAQVEGQPSATRTGGDQALSNEEKGKILANIRAGLPENASPEAKEARAKLLAAEESLRQFDPNNKMLPENQSDATRAKPEEATPGFNGEAGRLLDSGIQTQKAMDAVRAMPDAASSAAMGAMSAEENLNAIPDEEQKLQNRYNIGRDTADTNLGFTGEGGNILGDAIKNAPPSEAIPKVSETQRAMDAVRAASDTMSSSAMGAGEGGEDLNVTSAAEQKIQSSYNIARDTADSDAGFTGQAGEMIQTEVEKVRLEERQSEIGKREQEVEAARNRSIETTRPSASGENLASTSNNPESMPASPGNNGYGSQKSQGDIPSICTI